MNFMLWDTLPLRPIVLVVCPWCPDFDRTDPRHAGASHEICPSCRTKIERSL